MNQYQLQDEQYAYAPNAYSLYVQKDQINNFFQPYSNTQTIMALFPYKKVPLI